MKLIPIQSLNAHAARCGEGTGEVQRLQLPTTKREFLKGSGILFGAFAAGTPLALLAPSPVWAVELKSLSQPQGATLMQMGRVLYPHKQLPDAVYALLAKDLDAGAAKDAKQAQLLKDGLAALDKAAGGSFDKASDAQKLAAVKAIEGQPFFNAVRGQCITSLYDNDMAYAAFGFPGASWDKGGYITRGFQDLKWLPEPSAAASPKAYMG